MHEITLVDGAGRKEQRRPEVAMRESGGLRPTSSTTHRLDCVRDGDKEAGPSGYVHPQPKIPRPWSTGDHHPTTLAFDDRADSRQSQDQKLARPLKFSLTRSIIIIIVGSAQTGLHRRTCRMPAPTNQNVAVANEIQLYSNENGTKREWKSPPIPCDWASKFEAFLVALAVSSDARLSVVWSRGGDGNFFDAGNSGTAIIDSGAGTDAKVGMVGVGSSGTDAIGAFVQFKIGVQARAGASQVSAVVRLNSVFKAG